MRKLIILLLFPLLVSAQYNLFARQNFAKKVSNGTNTEIGGVSATITSAASLATKLGISVGNISNFAIAGSDIKCKITGNYTLPFNCFSGDSGLTYYYDNDMLVTGFGGNTVFYNCPNLYDLKLYGITSITSANCFQLTPLLVDLSFPNLISCGDTAFGTSIGQPIKNIHIPNCATLGSSVSGNNGVFANIPSGSVLYLKPSLATVNAGSPDGDIVVATTAGCIIRYVTNFIPPSAITTLAAGTIYNTAIQLTWTPPSSTNTIEYYEIYANGIYNSRHYTNTGYATGLIQNAVSNLTVYSVDIFRNKSSISNIVSQSTSNYSYTDTDANDYISAASLTGGAQESAYKLIVDLKSNSLYVKCVAIYPFKGSSSAQHKFNAKNPIDTDAAFRLIFTGAATFSNLGYQLNGSSYANTKLTPSTYQSLNNHGVTIVCGTNNPANSGDPYEFGSEQSSSQSYLLSLKNNNTDYKKAIRLNSTYATVSNGNESRGVFTAVKQSSTVAKLFRNNTSIISAGAGGTLPTIPQFIGAVNLSSSPYGYSNQRIQIAIIHEGLSDAEVSTLYSIIDLSETIAGRKTW